MPGAIVRFNAQGGRFQGSVDSLGWVRAGSPGTVSLTFRQVSAGTKDRGVIAKLAFRAKAPGVSPMAVQSASIKGSGGVPLAVKVEQGAVTVR